MICRTCKEQGKKSMVKFIDHKTIDQLWDFDNEGNMIERAVNVRIECSEGHQTDARVRGVLDKAEQV